MRLSPPIALAVLGVTIGVVFAVTRSSAPVMDAGTDADTGAAMVAGPDRSITTDPLAGASTPFAIVDEAREGVQDREIPAGAAVSGSISIPESMPGSGASADRAAIPTVSAGDIASIGLSPWTNAGFDEQLARFRADPEALALLIDAFRSETDPARLERLASLLGEIGHPDLAGIGAQMAASGDAVSRDAGLALLRTLQPNDAAARETLIGLLATESDPAVLDALIDAVAIPGEGLEGGGDGQADALVAQLVPLTGHPSAAVRRNGVAVLSRWGSDAGVTPLLQNALDDVDAGVRASAVYAFAERADLDASVRQDLLEVLENRQESRGTRSGAMLALQRTDLDTEQARRLQAVERELASTL